LSSTATIKEIAGTLHKLLTPPQDCQDDCADLVGKSAAISELKAFIRQIAPMNSTVLIVGETGTGKEVVARLLHRLSARSKSRLVCVNCAAIPDTLLESDLFGHECGAFTGAHKRQPGQIRLAHGGTLFLDEIGDMSLVAQSKLLRVVETREIRPLGGSVSSTVDIRLITATHRRLEQMVADDQFRSDLFYRINVARIEIPPLRERLEDVPVLARNFLAGFSSSNCKRIGDFTTGALQRLGNYDWPGNVRELKNVIEAAVVLCRSDVIREEDLRNLPPNLHRIPVHRAASSVLPTLPPGPEIDRLMEALRVTNWNYTQTARMLQWSRMTVYRKVAKYGMGRPGFEEYQTPELMGRVEFAN
jgi:transcriptional regulator with PAS, ATPase and Fis domain